MVSLEGRLSAQSNDYSEVESSFRRVTGANLTENGGALPVGGLRDSMSVVIPAYSAEETMPELLKHLSSQRAENFEVIIVDDGSPVPLDRQILDKIECDIPVKLVRQRENKGRSFTRNTGLMLASGTNVLFADHDSIVDNKFVDHFMVRLDHTEGCAYVGFRDPTVVDAMSTPPPVADYRNDWRYYIRLNPEFTPYRAMDAAVSPEQREYWLMRDSNFLKAMGKGATLGYWSLPSMVVGHGIGVRRSAALAAGGFPEKGFSGWGFEDNAFGAKLIGNGSMIVPCLDAVYFHRQSSSERSAKQRERRHLDVNIAAFRRLLASPVGADGPPEARRITKVGARGLLELFEVA